MGIRCPLFLLGLCILVLLNTAMLQFIKGSQCRHGGCPKDSICVNKTHCACEDGFITSSGNKYFSDILEICDDVNECVPPIKIFCGMNADCVNTYGSYNCTCITGYVLPSGEKNFPNASMNNCQDINECALSNDTCGQNAECVDENKGYHCICMEGYALPSGKKKFSDVTRNNCQDVDECQRNSSLCAPHGVCLNTPGSYMCTCKPGFAKRNGDHLMDCEDISKLPLNSEVSDELTNLSYKLQSFITINANWTAENKRRIGIEVTELLQNLEQVAWQDALRIPVKKQMLLNNSHLSIETHVISNCSQEEKDVILQAQNNSVKFSCMDIIGSNPQGSSAVAFLSYSSLQTIINASFFNERPKKSNGIYMISQVVSTAVGSHQNQPSSLSVLLTFQHIQKKKEERSLCVYWEAQGEKGGAWSTKNCNFIESNKTHIRCNCTHLSSFAVLIDLQEQDEDYVLAVITYVGLSFSLLCLFLAVLTFLLCPTIQNMSTSLHLQLSLCLFLANLLFLIGIKQTKIQVLCSIIAGLLHYFYLASFTWLLLEGLHLFLTARNLMVANYSKVNHSLRKVMYPLGYGIPAVIVAISAASRADFYGTSSQCWLQTQKGFLWAFLGPVCIIFSTNLVFILIIIWILQSKLSSLNSEVSTLQNTRLLRFKALSQLCILGCTWCLGLLQIGPAAWIMRYLFTIINSLQGVFIFLVYCLLNHQVQEQYKKWFKTIRPTKSESFTLSSKVVSDSTQNHTENQEENIKKQKASYGQGKSVHDTKLLDCH
ncbi:adhesion G protein-coupled receptor E3 isoform X1 [Sminthopsis crassicaudata]|uniref:adhesion G protein-coupled receptor E3 isoform X1 n=1 Tax=Sminthopsis crassicaudata TaxID=9301 RepID=UPI003D69C9A2